MFNASTMGRAPENSVKYRKGFSLVELLIVLAIIAALVAGVGALAGVSFSTVNSSNEGVTINQLNNAVKRLNLGDYGTTSLMDDLNAAGLLPSTIVEPSGTGFIYPNSWSGRYDVVGNNATFLVSSTNVPDENCIQILMTDIGGLLQTIEVNTTALASTTPTLAQARAACANGTQTITYTFS